MRPRAILAALVAVCLVGASALVSTALASNWRDESRSLAAPNARWAPDPLGAPYPPAPSPAPSPTPPSVVDPDAEVTVDIKGFLGWAVQDRTTGQVRTSDNAGKTSSTESMIKAWIVADYLRLRDEEGEEPSDRDLRDGRRAIRDSHNGATERLFAAAGYDASIKRMIDICELTDTYTPEGDEGWWSRTEISARDAMRVGVCLADGRAAGPQWTDWVLSEMQQVRGSTAAKDQRPDEGFEGGRWGIIDGLPSEIVADGVAIKNGWTRIGRTNSWHLSCLAITDDWVLAVLMRYPAEHSLDYGAQRCASVARQLIGDRFRADQVAGVT